MLQVVKIDPPKLGMLLDQDENAQTVVIIRDGEIDPLMESSPVYVVTASSRVTVEPRSVVYQVQFDALREAAELFRLAAAAIEQQLPTSPE